MIASAVDWHDRAIAFATTFYAGIGGEGALFEAARAYATACGLDAPKTSNAWGAVTLMMVRRGIIERTGQLRKSAAVKSHARQQPVWRLAL